jgi:GntR family transcriptional regulator
LSIPSGLCLYDKVKGVRRVNPFLDPPDHPEVGPGGRPRPAHLRIEAHLRRLIADGHGLSEPLPTEQELAEAFGVSRMTARQAFQRLVSSGVVVRYPSRGSFVAPRIVEDLTEWGRAGFTERWPAQGYEVELRVVAYELRAAGPDLAAQFDITPGDSLAYLERLRLVEGLPLTLDAMYMPAHFHSLLSLGDLSETSLVSLLPRHGIHLKDTRMEIGVRPAGDREAAGLGLQPGDTVVVRETLDTAEDGRLLISEISVYPAGRVSYRIQLDFARPYGAG